MRKLLFALLLGYFLIASSTGQESVDSARYLFGESQAAMSSGDFTRSELLLEQLLDGDIPLTDIQIAHVRNVLGFVSLLSVISLT